MKKSKFTESQIVKILGGQEQGKTFSSFNVIDDFNREAQNITIDTFLNSKRVIRELNQVIDWQDKPERSVSIIDRSLLLMH